MAKKNDIVKADSATLQPLENIENLIHVIRGKQVMLDRDLARLYGVETGRLNEQVKRNIERFPEDFMFQLNKDEFENWKSHFAISNSIKMGARKLPYAFTENGVAMLSGVLRSQQAISINIQIMRAFNTMRHFLASNAQVFQRLEVIEHTQLSLVAHQEDTDKKLEEVFRRLDEGEATPKEAIFYNGQFFEARVLLEQIIKTAKTRVIVIDAYVDAATFEMLDVRAKGVKADIYSGKDLRNIQNLHNTSSGLEPIEAHVWKAPSHDRWLIIDDTVYHCGHSLKDMGQKLSAIAQLGVDAEDILKKIR
jgi:phage regulator Rha-like protein